MFIRYNIINNLKFGFYSFSVAWLKLIPFDFQIKQKRFLFMNNDLFLWVMFRGFILVPSKQPMLILYFVQNGWILADVITPDRYFSFLMKPKKPSVDRFYKVTNTFYKTHSRSWYISFVHDIQQLLSNN